MAVLLSVARVNGWDSLAYCESIRLGQPCYKTAGTAVPQNGWDSRATKLHSQRFFFRELVLIRFADWLHVLGKELIDLLRRSADEGTWVEQ